MPLISKVPPGSGGYHKCLLPPVSAIVGLYGVGTLYECDSPTCNKVYELHHRGRRGETFASGAHLVWKPVGVVE